MRNDNMDIFSIKTFLGGQEINIEVPVIPCSASEEMLNFNGDYYIYKFAHVLENACNLECDTHLRLTIKRQGTVRQRDFRALICLKEKTISVFIRTPNTPELHPSTVRLVNGLSESLANKLLVSQIKMGLSEGWSVVPQGMSEELGRTFRSAAEINTALIKHLQKGDLLDSIAYLAFMRELGMSIDTDRFSGIE